MKPFLVFDGHRVAGKGVNADRDEMRQEKLANLNSQLCDGGGPPVSKWSKRGATLKRLLGSARDAGRVQELVKHKTLQRAPSAQQGRPSVLLQRMLLHL